MHDAVQQRDEEKETYSLHNRAERWQLKGIHTMVAAV